MHIHADHPEASFYKLYNKDTEEEIEYVVEADDETGIYSQMIFKDGEFLLKDDVPVIVIKKGNIELRRIEDVE